MLKVGFKVRVPSQESNFELGVKSWSILGQGRESSSKVGFRVGFGG